MASFGQDSDNMRAKSWRRKTTSSVLEDLVVDASDNKDLFNAVKESIQAFVDEAYGNPDD